MTQSASEILTAGLTRAVAPATPNPTPTPAPAATEPQRSQPFTVAQLRTLAQDAVARGFKTREEAEAALKADGVPDGLDGPAVNPAAAEIDAAFPPAKASEYQMPKLEDENGKYSPAMQQADQEIRSWLVDAKIPAGIGTEILQTAAAFSPKWAAMTQTDRTAHDQAEHGKLQRLWGADYPRKLDLARQLVRELEAKSPGKVIAVLDATGASANAMVIMHLADSAERLLRRKGAL